MSSWPIRIGVGVAVVLGLVLLLRPWRPAQRETESRGIKPLGTADEGKFNERVRQRIDQLRDAPSRLAAPARLKATPPMKMGGTAPSRQPAIDPNAPPSEEEPAPLIDDPEDIPTLQHIVLEDPDPERRLAAVALLGSSEDPQVIPVLGQALSDQNEEVRMAALESLSDFTDEPPVEAIENALNDSAPDIRFEAISILADIGGERARAAIERALNDPDEDVRTLAEGILDLENVYTDTPAAPGVSETPQPNG